MIKKIGLLLRGRLILLITRMITDRIGLHSVLLPLLIHFYLENTVQCMITQVTIHWHTDILSKQANIYKCTYDVFLACIAGQSFSLIKN